MLATQLVKTPLGESIIGTGWLRNSIWENEGKKWRPAKVAAI
jgi:hypothetical protein